MYSCKGQSFSTEFANKLDPTALYHIYCVREFILLSRSICGEILLLKHETYSSDGNNYCARLIFTLSCRCFTYWKLCWTKVLFASLNATVNNDKVWSKSWFDSVWMSDTGKCSSGEIRYTMNLQLSKQLSKIDFQSCVEHTRGHYVSIFFCPVFLFCLGIT